MGRGERAGIGTFLIATTAISAIFWTMIIVSGHLHGGDLGYVEGLMWSPALAAFLTVAIHGQDQRSLGLARWSGSAAVIAYLIPLGYAAMAYGLVWSTGFGIFPSAERIAKVAARLDWGFTGPAVFVPAYFVFVATTGMVLSLATGLGEEIGWRGFLTPRLVERFGFSAASVIAGLIWGCWHLPILLFADYNSGTEWWFAMSCFFVNTISIAFIATWLRLRSASVWPCAILHASHNVFVQSFFDTMTAPRGPITAYITGEFGVAQPLAVAACAAVVWSRCRHRSFEPGVD